jgi:hypothetical protein
VSGARIAMTKTIPLVKGQQITVCTNVRALNAEHSVQVSATVVVAYGATDPEHPEFLFYGVEFAPPEQLQMFALHACVQEHMVAELDGLGRLLMPEMLLS